MRFSHIVQKKTHRVTNLASAEPGHYRTWLEQNLDTAKNSQIRTNKTSTKTKMKPARAAPGKSKPQPDQNLAIAETVSAADVQT